MPFGITHALEPDEFKTQIIDHYFTVTTPGPGGRSWTLQEKIDADNSVAVTDKSKLIEDYCKLGSYLSKQAKVLAALKKLELAIRVKLADVSKATLKTQIEGFQLANYGTSNTWQQSSYAQKKTLAGTQTSEPIYFKTHKLLSSVLAEEEQRRGFNGFDPVTCAPLARTGTLHSRATVGQKDVSGNVIKTNPGFSVADGGRTDAVPLPSGVAAITGGASGMDFNRILLRHGYHWKDVGAGAVDHGEYTHRIQWYAITANNSSDPALALTNTPLEIFKTMGALWARSTYPAPLTHTPDMKTYLWEAMFDCFSSQGAANGQGSVAWASPGVYTCPDHLNKQLWYRPNDHAYDAADASNLFCLRVLMNARYFKRVKVGQASIDPLGRLMEANKVVKEAYKQDSSDAYLVWYLTQ